MLTAVKLIQDLGELLSWTRWPLGRQGSVLCYIHKLNHFSQNIQILLIISVARVFTD